MREDIYGNPYCKTRERTSKLASSATAHEEYYVCPRCSTELPSMHHGKRRVCCTCGLGVTRWGAGLTIDDESPEYKRKWKNKPDKAAAVSPDAN
ncbi:MAG: hypothetical protein WC505_06085 [Patescibacteria group bacterium]